MKDQLYIKYAKAANIVLEALKELSKIKQETIVTEIEDFRSRYLDLSKNFTLFEKATKRRFSFASKKTRLRIARSLEDFVYYTDRFNNIIKANEIKLPSPGDIVAELLSIEQEFGELALDLNSKTLSITIESITLEDIELGPFEIRFSLVDIKNIARTSPYKVIALNPNPAGGDCDVTHPHVSGEGLCEGDGIVPIRKAIKQGRLSDFFTIIVNILQNYNPDSPYIPLSEWDGVNCYDCGCNISGDESYYCEDCNNDFCSNCSSYCQICDNTICLGCGSECPICNNLVCKNCSSVCSECEQTVCSDCISEEGLCTKCEKIRKEQEYEEETTNACIAV